MKHGKIHLLIKSCQKYVQLQWLQWLQWNRFHANKVILKTRTLLCHFQQLLPIKALTAGLPVEKQLMRGSM